MMAVRAGGRRGGRGRRHAPWPHIVGFTASIALTFAALGLVLARAMRPPALEAAVLFLAVLQIGVQLFFFMHVTESRGPRFHAYALVLGLIFTIAIVAGSIWIMTFGGYQAY